MVVVEAVAAMVVAERDRHREHVLGAGQRHVHQPALLLEAAGLGERHVGRHVAVGGVDQVDGPPLAPFGGVDRAEDQVVVVQMRGIGEVAGAVGRVEGQLGEEAAPPAVLGGEVAQPIQVAEPRVGGVVVALEGDRAEPAQALDLGGGGWLGGNLGVGGARGQDRRRAATVRRRSRSATTSSAATGARRSRP